MTAIKWGGGGGRGRGKRKTPQLYCGHSIVFNSAALERTVRQGECVGKQRERGLLYSHPSKILGQQALDVMQLNGNRQPCGNRTCLTAGCTVCMGILPFSQAAPEKTRKLSLPGPDGETLCVNRGQDPPNNNRAESSKRNETHMLSRRSPSSAE